MGSRKIILLGLYHLLLVSNGFKGPTDIIISPIKNMIYIYTQVIS